MYAKTQFSELLKLFPKTYFLNQVKECNSDKYSKKFKSWNLFVLMSYGQLVNSKSMRSMLIGFNSQTHFHYHLNAEIVKRSTLSEALSKRSHIPFRNCCELLMKQLNNHISKDVSNMISIIDSTPIPLRGRGFEWTKQRSTYRVPGLKVHFAIDAENNTPTFIKISDSNINDITIAKDNLKIEKGVTYVMDKAYLDYNWWYKINEIGAKFVTRMKVNTRYKVIHTNQIKDNSNVISDEIIQLTNKHPRAKALNNYAFKNLRLVTVLRENGKKIHVVTNEFEKESEEISNLYKQRWQIELFFKWMKQKLKLKTFFGKSENSIKIQIYTAIICYLLIHLFKVKSKLSISMSELINRINYGLFNRLDIINYYARRKEKLLIMNRNQEVLL